MRAAIVSLDAGRGGHVESGESVCPRWQVTQLHNEVEAMGDMFTRMNRQCYEKCLNSAVLESRSKDDDLSLDDDNCVAACAGV